ncbi:MAG: fibronectin type III domain-containing protein [Alistipes sp.]
MQPFERSAFVTWSASDAEAWRVQWRPMDSAFYIGTETVVESQFDIDDLERRKDYVVRIAELSGQAEQAIGSPISRRRHRTAAMQAWLCSQSMPSGACIAESDQRLRRGCAS